MSHLSNYTYAKYLYLPIVQTYYPLVHTYYNTNVLSINTYSTNVLKYLYLVNPKSSTHVLSTIIGLAKTRVFILIPFVLKSFIVRLYKTNEEFKPTNKNKCFDSLTFLALLINFIYC